MINMKIKAAPAKSSRDPGSNKTDMGYLKIKPARSGRNKYVYGIFTDGRTVEVRTGIILYRKELTYNLNGL